MILINHEITYEIVMKKHLSTRCPRFERAGGAMTSTCHRSPAPLVIQSKKR